MQSLSFKHYYIRKLSYDTLTSETHKYYYKDIIEFNRHMNIPDTTTYLVLPKMLSGINRTQSKLTKYKDLLLYGNL